MDEQLQDLILTAAERAEASEREACGILYALVGALMIKWEKGEEERLDALARTALATIYLPERKKLEEPL